MEEPMVTRYWCHRCSQRVDPIIEVEIKCPICEDGFVEEERGLVEEMGAGAGDGWGHDSDSGSDRALSLWAPILLGMMGHPHRRRTSRRLEFDDEDDDDEDGESRHEGETELDREIESIIRRRRRSSATILQLLQGIRAGIAAESDDANRNRDLDREDGERDRDRDRDRDREQQERVIFINPFNQTIIVQGSSYDSTRNENTVGSLGDYFIGPGLDLLLQHLAENDPNRYGTPPAQKEAVESMPTVKIKETLQCSVCLDDFEIGAEAKEMPCKHKFHCGCILPWLELHSSCPVCRFQLPADESKLDSDGSRNVDDRRQRERESENGHESGEDGNGDEGNGNSRRFSIPWPFSGLFSSSGSQSGEGNSPSSSSATQANGHEGSSQMDEN